MLRKEKETPRKTMVTEQATSDKEGTLKNITKIQSPNQHCKMPITVAQTAIKSVRRG